MVDTYVPKIIQLYETMLVRHGVMVVGLTLTGKRRHSTPPRAHQLKRDGDEPHYEVTKRHTLNPKAVKMGELTARSTRDPGWTDGLPTLVRLSVGDESDALNWIVFDGPVDALWIENMNTVLGNNKMLCLSNGERIKLSKGMHMMFENDLAVAPRHRRAAGWCTWRRCTSATARSGSRGASPALPSNTENAASLLELLDGYVDGALFVRDGAKEAGHRGQPDRLVPPAAVGVAHRGERRFGVGRHGDAREECGPPLCVRLRVGVRGNLRESSREV